MDLNFLAGIRISEELFYPYAGRTRINSIMDFISGAVLYINKPLNWTSFAPCAQIEETNYAASWVLRN